MPRPRETPSDRRWLAQYFEKAGIELTPEEAVQALDGEAWRRLQAAYRAHRAKSREAGRRLAPESWIRLELIARRVGRPRDLDAAIARLSEVPDLGGLVRDALTR